MNNTVTRRTFAALLALAALIALGPTVGWAAEYQVIVNLDNPTISLTRDQLGKVFLKKTVEWDDGTPILPVDQAPISPVRAAFNRLVHQKSAGAIASYWQQQIFVGREVPPAEKAGDGAVIAFVKANPGAIGYVSAEVRIEGVRRLGIR